MLTNRRARAIAIAALASVFVVGASPPGGSDPKDPETVVRSLYAAFERGDAAAIEALIAPEATWTYYGPAELPFAGTRHGPSGVADFFAKVEQTLSNPVPEQRDFIVTGSMVAVPGSEESTVKATGIRYRADNVHLFKVVDGKIVSFEEFIDSGKVLLAFRGERDRKPPVASASPRGKAIYTACAGCHGNNAEGRPEMFAPPLAGQHPDYLVRQLVNFRTGKRGKLEDGHAFQMGGRANAIPDDKGVSDVITFAAALPALPAARPGPANARIKAVVDGCAACHGKAGEGDKATKAPALNLLSSNYIAAQLRNFRGGLRGYATDDEEGAMMAAAAASIPDEATLTQVANHYGRK